MFADVWASALIVSLDPLKLKQNSPRSVIACEGLGATAIRMTTTSERRGTRFSGLCMWRLPRGVGLSSRQDGRGSGASCPTAGSPAETLAQPGRDLLLGRPTQGPHAQRLYLACRRQRSPAP